MMRAIFLRSPQKRYESLNSPRESLELVIYHMISDTGFMGRLRENYVDESGFIELIGSIEAVANELGDNTEIDRQLVGCLFEAPWEIKNTITHYKAQEATRGRRVSQMADELRSAIHNMLWRGIDTPHC